MQTTENGAEHMTDDELFASYLAQAGQVAHE